MPDPLPPVELPPTPTPTRTPRLVCEFCECQLTPTGDAFRMSDKARTFAKMEEDLRVAREALTAAQNETAAARTELSTVQRQLSELTTKKQPASGW